jgi:hypothetical protein
MAEAGFELKSEYLVCASFWSYEGVNPSFFYFYAIYSWLCYLPLTPPSINITRHDRQTLYAQAKPANEIYLCYLSPVLSSSTKKTKTKASSENVTARNNELYSRYLHATVPLSRPNVPWSALSSRSINAEPLTSTSPQVRQLAQLPQPWPAYRRKRQVSVSASRG